MNKYKKAINHIGENAITLMPDYRGWELRVKITDPSVLAIIKTAITNAQNGGNK